MREVCALDQQQYNPVLSRIKSLFINMLKMVILFELVVSATDWTRCAGPIAIYPPSLCLMTGSSVRTSDSEAIKVKS